MRERRKKRAKVLKTLPFQYATPEQAKEYIGRYCFCLDKGRDGGIYEIKRIDDSQATLVSGENGKIKIVDCRFIALLKDDQVEVGTIKKLWLESSTENDFMEGKIVLPVPKPEELRWVRDISEIEEKREIRKARTREIKIAHMKESFIKAIDSASKKDFIYLRMLIYIGGEDRPAIVTKFYPKGFFDTNHKYEDLFIEFFRDINNAIGDRAERVAGCTIKQWTLEELIKHNPDGIFNKEIYAKIKNS